MSDLAGRPSPFDFPCAFAIKALGPSEPDFDALVVSLIRPHVADLAEGAVTTRPSRAGRWTAVTVTIEAVSQAQLDAIYQSLSTHEKVVMAL